MAHIFLGMSGGVDSSAAAVLLRDAGYAVHGLHLSMLKGLPLPEGRVPDDGADAGAVARMLGLPFHDVDLSECFRQTVVDYFIREYEAGRTPNPCVFCNRTIKFAAFAEKAKELGYDFIATGHYSRVDFDPEDGRWHLTMGDDDSKDQSYVLWSLTQEQLSRMVLPLSAYRKEEIRELARQAGLPVFNKKDSQDICFIPDGDFAAFLCRYTGEEPPRGSFVDREGRVLGTHEGIWRYTIGQRRGLGIGFGQRMFVCGIDPEHRHPDLRGGAVPEHPHRRRGELHRGGVAHRAGAGHRQDPLCRQAGSCPAHTAGERPGAAGV